MKHLSQFIFSPIGSKIIMALAGTMIFLFLIGHVLGNLLIFNGSDSLNTYAHWLQNNPLLWVFRLTMLGLLSLHIFIALRLYIQNKYARPISYQVDKDIQLGFSEKTMIVSGLLIFIFIIFHIGHLTLGWLPTTSLAIDNNIKMVNVYENIVNGFQVSWVALFYIVSMLIIGLHLHHSLKSLFQTLGFHNHNLHWLVYRLTPIMIAVLVLAFISIPAAVLMGWIQ
ncbi:MAG: succinate dehydrogenase cytochrome b subunit [Gammaproteobacteria bacterium]|nr:succinate dehydrogenase cytochrome b subunit [Gammaproteobacteria bacterium]